jgi:hypothetical protein
MVGGLAQGRGRICRGRDKKNNRGRIYIYRDKEIIVGNIKYREEYKKVRDNRGV